MGKYKTPTAIAETKGAFDKHPERRRERANEPKPTEPVGDPPEHLNEYEVECWHYIVDCLHPGVAFKPDRLALEVAAKQLAEIRWGEKTNVSLMGQFHKFLAAFGLTPADRAKIQVDAETPDDGWGGFKH